MTVGELLDRIGAFIEGAFSRVALAFYRTWQLIAAGDYTDLVLADLLIVVPCMLLVVFGIVRALIGTIVEVGAVMRNTMVWWRRQITRTILTIKGLWRPRQKRKSSDTIEFEAPEED